MTLPPSTPNPPVASGPGSRRRRRWPAVVIGVLIAAALTIRFTLLSVSETKVDAATYDGTANMAARLKDIFTAYNPNRVIIDRTPRIALIGSYLKDIKNPADDERGRILLEVQAAELALQRGEGETAIAGFQRAREDAMAHSALFDAEFFHALGRELAISELRLGEQQNCVAMHNAESCLFPLAGGGVHMVQAGPRAAAKEYLAILDRFPDDLTARWLLNIAYMTFGEWPDKVPSKWLIPASAFKSDYDMPRFPQIAGDVGLDTEGRAGGVI